MLAGKRAARVGEELLREVADVLTKKVRDPRVQAATLTGIELSNDLKHARVYYSFMGAKEDIKRVQAGLDSAKGFIKREVGLRLELKYFPDIVFKFDPTLERAQDMEALFERLRSAEPQDDA
jgi:ribosome-binding factor A